MLLRSCRAVALFAATLCSSCTRNPTADSKQEAPAARASSEPGDKDAVCLELGERLLGEGPSAGLTTRRLPDGRVAMGFALRGEPHIALVGTNAEISLRKAGERPAPQLGIKRVTPQLQRGELTALVDVQDVCPELVDCRRFASNDGSATWLVGSRVKAGGGLTLVVKREGEPERELVSQPAAARQGVFEDLESAWLGDRGVVLAARYHDSLHLLRLKPDFSLAEKKIYGPGFVAGPQLVSAGSGAMLITARNAFGRSRLTWSQFDDPSGGLPEHFAGSEHGLTAQKPRLATAGSQRWLGLLSDDAERRIVLLPITAYFDAAGRGHFVTRKGVEVDELDTVGFDDGRVVVVYVTGSTLMAKSLRCRLQP